MDCRKGRMEGGFGLTRAKRDAATLRNSRRNHANSPHARLTVMVSDRIQKRHSLLSTHGGLVLLAIPFQLMLVIVPLGFVIFIPDEWIRPNRRLEVALACYLIVLIMVMRVFPKFARKTHHDCGFYKKMANFNDQIIMACTCIGPLADGPASQRYRVIMGRC